MSRLPKRSRTVAVALAATVLAMMSSIATPAFAAFHSPSDFNRNIVIRRARDWVKASPEYNQGTSFRGYRQDCSGFVSMAWGLRKSYVTWTLPEVAWPIHKSDLSAGDIMLDKTGAGQHVVIFERWANAAHTAYWDYELAGSTNRPVHRVVPYPFWTGDRDDYKPYRFASAARYTGQRPKPKAAPRPKPASKAATVTAAAKPVAKVTTKVATKTVPKTASARVAPKHATSTPSTARPVAKKTAKVAVARTTSSPRHRPRHAEEPLALTLLRTIVAWLAA